MASLALVLWAGQPPKIKTGPSVGARIPEFTASDQYGRPRTFESLRGPEGLVLMFVRSADW